MNSSTNWRCAICTAHDMNEDTAFSHAERLRHRIVIQLPGDELMITKRKPYTEQEKADLIARGEARFSQYLAGDLAAHKADCRCLECFYAVHPEFNHD